MTLKEKVKFILERIDMNKRDFQNLIVAVIIGLVGVGVTGGNYFVGLFSFLMILMVMDAEKSL